MIWLFFFAWLCLCTSLMWSTSIQKQLVGHVIHLVAKVTHQIRMDLNCWCLKKINRGHRSGMCTSAANILLGVSMPTDRNYRFFSPSSHASLFLHPSLTSPVSLDLCGWRHWPVILFPMSSSLSSPYLSSLLFHVSILTSVHLLSLWSRWSHSESQWVTFFFKKSVHIHLLTQCEEIQNIVLEIFCIFWAKTLKRKGLQDSH